MQLQVLIATASLYNALTCIQAFSWSDYDDERRVLTAARRAWAAACRAARARCRARRPAPAPPSRRTRPRAGPPRPRPRRTPPTSCHLPVSHYAWAEPFIFYRYTTLCALTVSCTLRCVENTWIILILTVEGELRRLRELLVRLEVRARQGYVDAFRLHSGSCRASIWQTTS